MSAINLNNLTPEIVEKLLKIYEQGKGEEQPTMDRNTTYVLPEGFLQDSEESSKKELAQNISMAKGGSEIFQDLHHLIERGGGDEGEILQIMKKARRLSVYGFASAKAIVNDAKTVATKALKLPENLIALGKDEEDEDKELAFSSEVVQRIQKARYDDKIIRGSQASASRSEGFANGGFRGPQNNRGRGSYSYNNRGGFTVAVEELTEEGGSHSAALKNPTLPPAPIRELTNKSRSKNIKRAKKKIKTAYQRFNKNNKKGNTGLGYRHSHQICPYLGNK
ncbi:hypothetical protein A0J61_10632 [Choanephora cucurbitarum]|uniref:Uncharacterized protein n=1 Tax=Choanephora cucurbitarum TaxID=101091 RepID=A0A1C7MWY8_9FUNG|nr:hypothetical protein A0J61_10632 [Choanephora cucurbitarum]